MACKNDRIRLSDSRTHLLRSQHDPCNGGMCSGLDAVAVNSEGGEVMAENKDVKSDEPSEWVSFGGFMTNSQKEALIEWARDNRILLATWED